MMLRETIKGSKYADATVLATIDNWVGGNRNIKYKAELDWFQEKMITKKCKTTLAFLRGSSNILRRIEAWDA